ncbi:MAG: hypothetical protein JNM61_01625 [Zoogloeaceae bacterium]|nr:hypothetical protein [Zoogloeaceae bacterium]
MDPDWLKKVFAAPPTALQPAELRFRLFHLTFPVDGSLRVTTIELKPTSPSAKPEAS